MYKYIYIIACLSLAYSTTINQKTDSNYDFKKQQSQIGTMSKKEIIILEKKTYTSRDCNDSWISDGYCDDINNTEECSWDGGDCCESTCKDSHYICSEGNKYETCHAGFLPGLEAEFHKDVAVAEEGIFVETVVVPTIDWEWGAPNAKTWHGLNPNDLVESWEKFALFIKGFIYISNAGRYDFCLRSDDGSSLYLDSKLDETVYNENYHSKLHIHHILVGFSKGRQQALIPAAGRYYRNNNTHSSGLW